MTGQHSTDVHTMPDGKAWINRQGDRVIGRHHSLEDALFAGRLIAREAKAQHLIHDAEGRIRERMSYGEEPSQHEIEQEW